MCCRTLSGCVSWCVLVLLLPTQFVRAADLAVEQDRFALAAGEERVALSLRVLSAQVSRAQALTKPLPEDCRTLAGIGVIEGFLLAEDADPDVILVGRKSPSRPFLRLDDLVNSLRCTGQKQYPYCSLDPRVENVRALQRLLQQNQRPRTSEELKAQFEAVKKAVGPQQIVVGGVPRNSRHGRIMIAADYHMKKVSQGLVSVTGVVSCPDRVVREAKAQFQKDGNLPAGGASMSRFWFHVAADDPKYGEDTGIVWLDNCRVVLLTEQQRATVSGQLQDVRQDDPTATAFARELSEAFPKLTSEVPVYAELENLFRLYAVTLAIAQRGVLDKIGSNCDSYLEGYAPAEERPMPETLPGLANYRELELPFQQGNRQGVVTLFPIVCGGVGMDMRVDRASFSHAPGARLSGARLAVLTQRPDRDALAWTVRLASSGRNEGVASELEALRKNSTKEVTLFAVDRRPTETTLRLPHALVRLNPDELARLQAGKRLEDNHPLSKALAESGRMMVLYTPEGKSPEDAAAADQVAFALQKAYREKHFGQSLLTPRTKNSAESFGAMRVNGLADIVTVIAGDSFGVQDFNLKGNLSGALRQANLNVELRVLEKGAVPRYQGGKRKQMIVISGHIDENLIAFLRSLGENGYFQENHVLLNTCSDKATRAAAMEMIKKYGALTVFRYDRPIKGWEVQKFLIELFQRSKSGTNQPFVDVIRDLLQEYGLNGIWDFCQLDLRLWNGLQASFVKVNRGTDGRGEG